ncbi:MAG: hypothetical protein P0116_06730 [Candidatus Nitrosocosmicus sp.]|nr:hypothetical protein [Candidatus Nitrosocosmicus sp.]
MMDAAIKKVGDPIELYKNPPIINPIILAKLDTACHSLNSALMQLPANFESIDMNEGHINPLPHCKKDSSNINQHDVVRIKIIQNLFPK